MKNKCKNIYIDFSENFDKKILSCITVSNDLYDSKDTLDRFLNEKKISSNKIAYCEQVHSNNVVFIDKPGIYYNSDGLVSKSNAGIFLQIHTFVQFGHIGVNDGYHWGPWVGNFGFGNQFATHVIFGPMYVSHTLLGKYTFSHAIFFGRCLAIGYGLE